MTKVARPKVIGGITVKKATGCGNMYIQMNWYRGRLFEVFATLGHSGGCSMCFTEALTRSITIGLRQEVPVAIEDFIGQLSNIRCLSPYPFPVEERTLSCPDAIARALEEYGSLSVDEIVKIMLDSDGDIEPDDTELQIAEQEISRLREEREKQGL